MSVVRYKSYFHFGLRRTVVAQREFAKASGSRLYPMPDQFAGGPKWIDARDWPHATFEDARQAGIDWHREKAEVLEKEAADHRRAAEQLAETTEPTRV